VTRKRAIRLMQEDSLVARARKRYKGTTDSDHDQPVAANVLNLQFTAEAPNQRWVGDTTEFTIGESGTLYLAAVVDLFSRFVAGWAISAVNDRHLTLAALSMALQRRCPEAGLLHHSDRGSTYASEDYQDRLAAHGITRSMSRTGDCCDNAVMEAFFSTLKTELADTFASHGEAKRELFDYIEAFYNTRRRHSTLDYVSPAECERRFRSGDGTERCA
jgi:putative transposase